MKTPKQIKKAKPEAKTNRSILTFFRKVTEEQPLFIEGPVSNSPPRQENDDLCAEDDVFGDAETADPRFNEIELPNKRQKVSNKEGELGGNRVENIPLEHEIQTVMKVGAPKTVSGFIIDDSEDEAESTTESRGRADGRDSRSRIGECDLPQEITTSSVDRPPGLTKMRLKIAGGAESDRLTDIEDWPDDTDMDGAENRELRLSQQYADGREEEEISGPGYSPAEDLGDMASEEESCPICNGSLAGATAEEATWHVNGCLDGNPTPLPGVSRLATSRKIPQEKPNLEMERLQVDEKIPPATSSGKSLTSGASASAFSKLMAYSVEEAEWSAAQSDTFPRDSRNANKKRPCPFYKIMPGFSISVDAFRYGAVEGCNAYFLSHFHSDHYVGLASSWSHGPIYCSKVTASLCKQQLRVDEKWLVPLEFEKRYDVPNTGGATVVLIDANHCPGSALFLFEMAVGGSNGRKQRILHCGDFRACKAHVTHPLLRPKSSDPKTGGRIKQTIDACYLDTTYLNPRYSFPPQDDVITACADLCAFMQANPGLKRPWGENVSQGSNSMSRFVSLTQQAKATAEPPPEPPANPFTLAPGAAKVLQPAQTHPSNKSEHAPNRLLVVCGTYSIGKERIVLAIARALRSKIFAPAHRRRVCKALCDPELDKLMTSDPLEAQVHMQSLMEVKAESLTEYLEGFKPHFARAVAFRPSGWTYFPGQGVRKWQPDANATSAAAAAAAAVATPGPAPWTIKRGTAPSTIPTTALLHHPNWRTRLDVHDLRPLRGWTDEAMVFGVPYSEHSSFRDLALFVMALDVSRIIPTVNVGTKNSRATMRAWTDRWMSERRRGGMIEVFGGDGDGDGDRDGDGRKDGKEPRKKNLWDGKGIGRRVFW